ncbi:MAG: XylR family transcriptional regulator [Pirellulales bacterium]|nr:XylR family transcriptional regulator [Pirellulales bacterium]
MGSDFDAEKQDRFREVDVKGKHDPSNVAGSSDKRIKVALLIESSRAYGRGVLRGIAAYARTHTDWSIYQHERALGDAPPTWLRTWQGHGVIARIETKLLAKTIQKLDLPAVDLRGRFALPRIPVIETNDKTVVQMACDHLLGRGYRIFAFCGFAGANYSDRRRTFMIQYLAKHHIQPNIHESPYPRLADTSRAEAEGILHEEDLGRWLVALEKPAALLTCNDIRALQVLGVCREQGIRIPDDIAVLGIDNDDLLCELADPPLSSVENDTQRIGFEAADLLAKMIDGRAPPRERILIDPLQVVTRKSTDMLAIDDAEVVAALRFIQKYACHGISVSDVVKRLPLSRSTLERRFAKFVGQSLKTEINRVRIERIKQLLADTNYKLPVIAKMTGFMHSEYMSTLFKQSTGMTAGEYRRAHANRANP